MRYAIVQAILLILIAINLFLVTRISITPFDVFVIDKNGLAVLKKPEPPSLDTSEMSEFVRTVIESVLTINEKGVVGESVEPFVYPGVVEEMKKSFDLPSGIVGYSQRFVIEDMYMRRGKGFYEARIKGTLTSVGANFFKTNTLYLVAGFKRAELVSGGSIYRMFAIAPIKKELFDEGREATNLKRAVDEVIQSGK